MLLASMVPSIGCCPLMQTNVCPPSWRKLQRYSYAWAHERHARGQTTTMSRAALAAIAAFFVAMCFGWAF